MLRRMNMILMYNIFKFIYKIEYNNNPIIISKKKNY